MPDSSRRCGDFTAPAQRITSPTQRASRAFAAMRIGDPNGTLAVEEDPGGKRLGLDAQIAAAPGRIQKGARRRPTTSILLCCLEITKTFLVAIVVVRIARETLGHRGFDESVNQLGALAQSGNVEGTAAPARIIATRLVMF